MPEPTTPCYVYDLAEIRRSYGTLSRNLPQPSKILYALKANPHPDVVATLLGQGCRAEVSSPGELDAALRAGADARDVLYTGPAKRREDLDTAIAAGVRQFSADSAYAVRELASVAAYHGVTIRYLLRVNPELAQAVAGLAMTGMASQFGADEDAILAKPHEFTRYPEAVFDGLHFYLATNMKDTDSLMTQFRVALKTALRVEEILDVQLNTLDLGGGFGAPYAVTGQVAANHGLAGQLSAELDSTFPNWREQRPLVVFESGRALVATSGKLLTRVLDVKRTHGKRIVVLDSGIHQLGGMAGLRRVPPLRPDVLATASAAQELESAIVCGPLCTPLDRWSSDHPLPAVAPGDLLAVPNVGAYGLTASLALFLSHPMPVELVVDGSRVVSATQLTTFRREVEPPY
jgi:diaminopimelate decarboxylase